VIPFAVFGVFWAGTWLAHAVEEPDLGDPGTLSPTGTGPDGSSRLADRLTARGVRIERVTSSEAAIQAASSGGVATVFLPTPDLLHPTAQNRLAGPGAVAANRVIVVRPGLRGLLTSPAPIFATGSRWAAGVASPRCATPTLALAGPAAVMRDRYEVEGPESVYCYGGAVAGARLGDTEFIFVGATDPFRNSRLDEHGNAALATTLLAATDRVIWVDVHARERVNVDVEVSLPEYRRGDRDRGGTGFPTIDAFPPLLWAVLVLAAGATALLAVARARRLGPPVAEPLPVLVPAAETVTGRGRLYHRIAARQATLDALRSAAIARLTRMVDPFGPAVPSDRTGTVTVGDDLVHRISQHTGWPEAAVRATLEGPAGDSDDDLVRAVADLDALVAAVHDGVPRPDPPDRHRGGPP
jgi:hypothetical protein